MKKKILASILIAMIALLAVYGCSDDGEIEIPEYISIQRERISTEDTQLLLNDHQLDNVDIKPLRYMVNLTLLSLSGNQISDISPLAGLANLSGLNLSLNQISDIGLLDKLVNLTQLDLSLNEISDISALEGLVNLTGLSLQNNQISDISALSGLTNLSWLILWDNPLAAEQIAELRAALPDTEIFADY